MLLDFLSKTDTGTFYRQTTGRSEFVPDKLNTPVTEAMKTLFAAGKRHIDAEKQKAQQQKHTKVSIKYWAPQIVGEDENGTLRAGAKLIGFLKNPIDTRAESLVRVVLPRGGSANGVDIDPGSVAVGNFSYGGSGNIVYLKFSRLDPPDNGTPKKVSASALDAANFAPGIKGEEFTNSGDKVAASIGLNMFSGMADTLTDRESLGNSYNGVQTKANMKNALLQGISKASQDEATRAATSIEQQRSYVTIPEGKEMIIELLEDYK